MDASKKRKTNENGSTTTTTTTTTEQTLTLDDARKLLKDFTHEQLLSLSTTAVTRHPDILSSARSLADADVSRRKLFVRGLGPETTTDSLKSLFSTYGELDEAVVISDKATGKSKGYGFVTFKHIDGAMLALKQPSKKIDGRMTVTHLAAAGRGVNGEDQATRKIYVGNVPYEVSPEKLLEYFSVFGEIEEGPLGFDKQGGKSRGFAFFVYKTEEGARMSLMEPVKMIEGHQVMCKFAEDGKKGKVNPVMPGEMSGGGGGDRMVGSMGSQYGGGGMSHYGPGGYGSGPGPVGVGGGYGGSGGGGSYGVAQSQYGGPGAGDYMSYRMPPPASSMGGPPTYQESGVGGGYGGSSGGYMSQGPPPLQGPPPSGMYQRMPPPYY